MFAAGRFYRVFKIFVCDLLFDDNRKISVDNREFWNRPYHKLFLRQAEQFVYVDFGIKRGFWNVIIFGNCRMNLTKKAINLAACVHYVG